MWTNAMKRNCLWLGKMYRYHSAHERNTSHNIFFHFALNWHIWYLMWIFDFMKLSILSMFSKLFLAVCWVRPFPDLLLTQPNQLRSWEALLCKIHTSSIPQVQGRWRLSDQVRARWQNYFQNRKWLYGKIFSNGKIIACQQYF